MVMNAPQITEKETWEPVEEGWTSPGETAPEHLPEASQLNGLRRAEGSSLICTNFSDKLSLKIQLHCNQKSKPTRTSLASHGGTRTTSDPRGAGWFTDLRQGTGSLLVCPQHDQGPGPPLGAPSQFPPLPKVLWGRQKSTGKGPWTDAGRPGF